MKRQRNKWFFLLVMSVIMLLPTVIVRAAGLAIEYDGQAISYTDTQVSYKIDGKRISSIYPGIIIDGISLAPCSEVFIDSNVGITYKYNEAKGLLYLYHGKNEIRFTLGSKTAKVNGTKVTLPLAPRLIRFTNKGAEKLYVPARFVAERFGFTYNWDAKTGVASITSPSWKIRYDGTDYDYRGLKLQVTSNGKNGTTTDYPGIVINGTVMVPAKLTFAGKAVGATYQYDSTKKYVSIKKYGNTIMMALNSKTAKINGVKVKLKEAPRSIKFYQTGVTVIYVPLQDVAEAIRYQYIPASNNKTIELKAPDVLYYNKQWQFPTTKGKVTFDGTEVNVSPAYSYIENNTAVLRAKKVFASALGCSYQYDSKEKKLTLKKDENTVVFTMESSTAYVNGEKKKLDAPARVVKNGSNGNNYIMVPGRFTANALGFDYEWVSETSTSAITTPKPSEDNPTIDPENPDDPENPSNPTTPDDPSIPTVPTTQELFRWTAGDSFQTYLSDFQENASSVHELTGRKQTGTETLYTSLLSVDQGSEMEQGLYDTYYLHSPDGFFDIIGMTNGSMIELTLSETISTNQIYVFADGLVAQAKVEYQETSKSTLVSLALTEGAHSDFQLTLSEDHQLLTVKVYRTCLTSVTGEQKNGDETITISGTGKINAEILSDDSDGVILLQIDGMLDTLSETEWTNVSGEGITSVTRIPVNANQTQLLVQRKQNKEYYLTEAGDSVKLIVKGERSDLGAYALKIPYMPGTNLDSITDSDDYLSHRFTITLPGDQLAYLENNPIVRSDSKISSIQKKVNSSGNTVITVTTPKLQAYKLHYESGAILVEVDDPKNLYDKIVVLDAGHGGKDPGAQFNNVNEKDLNLQMIYTRLKQYFEASDEIKVYWTRTDDTFIELNDRAAYASKVGADLFISLHMNSYTTATPKGLSVFYSTQNKTQNSGGLTSLALAELLQKNLISGLGATDRKVKSNAYIVCKSNTVPAVLIELGFMSNPSEFAKLTSKSYQQKTAKILYDSIVEIFNKYPTGR